MVEIVGIKSQKDIEILFQLTHFTVLLVLDYAFIIAIFCDRYKATMQDQEQRRGGIYPCIYHL